MAASYGSIFTGSNLFTSDITLDKPSGTTSGDLLVMSIAIQGADATATTPSGWTLLHNIDTGGASSSGDERQYTFYKFAGASEPASYTVTLSAIKFAVGGIIRIVDAKNTAPADASGSDQTVSSINTSPVTTSADGGIYLIIAVQRDSTLNTSSVSGYTQRGSNERVSNSTISFFTRDAPSSGSSGTETVNFSATVDDIAYSKLAIEGVKTVSGRFEAAIDMSSTLDTYYHAAQGRFEAVSDFNAEYLHDHVISGQFDAAVAFDTAIYETISGRFEIASAFSGLLDKTYHNISGRFEAAIAASSGVAFDFRVLEGRFEAAINFDDSYAGRGTGLVWTFPSSVDSSEESAYELNKFLSQLRVGDEFPGYLPLAGVNGKTGTVRVVARRYNDSLETPDLDIQFIEYQDPEVINRLKEDSVIPFIPKSSGNLFRNIIELRKRFRSRDT